METLVIVGVTLAWIVMVWGLSLRKTPYKFAWATFSALMGFLAVVLGFATHDWTPAGTLAMEAIPGGLMGAAGFCTEVVANEGPDKNGAYGEIRMFREARKALPAAPHNWLVEVHPSDSNDSLVAIWLKNGGSDRLIGESDPVNDMDNYQKLYDKALEAAGTYNGIGVKPKPSTELVVRR